MKIHKFKTKEFYNIGPGFNAIKLFTSLIYEYCNKLLFAPCKPFQPSLMFAGQARSLP